MLYISEQDTTLDTITCSISKNNPWQLVNRTPYASEQRFSDAKRDAKLLGVHLTAPTPRRGVVYRLTHLWG